jgi:hypothetical protein
MKQIASIAQVRRVLATVSYLLHMLAVHIFLGCNVGSCIQIK